jgi:hypothetical protein
VIWVLRIPHLIRLHQRLLLLGRALMARQSNLAARVRATVRDRIGAELVTSHGDLVTEEIEDAEVEELSVSLAAAGAASD